MSALTVTAFPVADLKTFHKNPRRGSVARIAESLAARGQYRPIVVNVGTATGRPLEVLAGNHTLAAAISLGWVEIQATTVDVDDAAAAQIVLADNRLADLGTYDESELLELLQSAGDLFGTGYDDRDVSALIAALDEPVALTEPDDVPALTSVSVSSAGDVWSLGPHRLLVGSSGDIDAVTAAAQGVPDVIWTDPPYGVNYVGGSGMTIKNDGPAEALAVFLDALGTCLVVARPGAPIYVAHADTLRLEFQRALQDAGVSIRQTLIWVKDQMVLSRADYHYKHEPILAGVLPEPADEDYEPIIYGFVPGGEGRLGRGGPAWFGDNKSTTVLQVARPRANREHPTMKPVELVELMLKNSCPPGGIVFDPFAGSGSTMIAAHRLGMRALLVELDPQYADVICRRWEQHTGVVPMLDGVPVSFIGVD